jgi:mRNA-degrading endonuclease RelE of RelBE toxin-antitoxin system
MRVVITAEAEKQYKHLPKTEQKKIKKKLVTLENYAYAGKKLTGDLTGLRSLRAWPYRILYAVDEIKQEVTVNSIQHRQTAYKM